MKNALYYYDVYQVGSGVCQVYAKFTETDVIVIRITKHSFEVECNILMRQRKYCKELHFQQEDECDKELFEKGFKEFEEISNKIKIEKQELYL
jgi:hypothetical protein